MFISREEADRRLSHRDNLVRSNPTEQSPEPTTSGQAEVKPLHNGGRRPGDKNMPDFLRAVVGTMAHLSTAKEVGSAFGISPHHVHELKHGKTTTDKVDPELKDQIKTNLGEVEDLALLKLMDSLGCIDKEDLENCKPRELAAISRDLATVAEKARPQTPGTSHAQVIIYAPRVKEVDELPPPVVLDITPET